MSAHTPGPWFTCAQVKKPHNFALVGIGNGAVHVGYASVTPAMFPMEADANVRLMSAAPELLSVAKQAEDDLRIFQEVSFSHLTVERVADLLDALRAAIAKAEGKEAPEATYPPMTETKEGSAE